MDWEFSHMGAELSQRPVSEFIGCNASICCIDAVYTKSKSEPLGRLIFLAQATVADCKERGIPKV